MKLLLLGAGVRTPLLLHGLIRRQQTLGLTEVRLYDNDPARLTTMGAFARYLAERQGASFRVEVFEDFRAAATGAGDCFNAGFLYGLLHERPIGECLRYGNICGGLSVAVSGGFAGAPTEAELLARARALDVASVEG
jgi:sugar/nucleoside kinase (ribokinase family)